LRPHVLIALVLLLIAVSADAGREPSTTGDVGPGVTASFKHKIAIVEETWPSALSETYAGRQALRLERAGGFKLHTRVRSNPDDYIICVIYVEQGGRLVLDESTSFVFRYGDHEIASTEVLLTDGPTETRVFSTNDEPVVLTAETTRYCRAQSGGFLAAVRFPGNSLPAGHGSWVPDSFDLRGGERDEESSG
jgi:hypothetical protein